jgi:hypothetical protein
MTFVEYLNILKRKPQARQLQMKLKREGKRKGRINEPKE